MDPIYYIETSYQKTVNFYLQLIDQNPLCIEDVETLKKMHEDVIKAIGEYFVYLDKEGIPRRDSYLTQWIEKDFLYDTYEYDILCFLERHLGSS
jgi:hypothetical protein